MKWVEIVALSLLPFHFMSARAQAYGSSQDATVTALPTGNLSCGDWVTDRKSNSLGATEQEFWLNGFVVGIEVADAINTAESVSLTTDTSGLYVWIDNYCQKNPTNTLLMAAAALINSDPPIYKEK